MRIQLLARPGPVLAGCVAALAGGCSHPVHVGPSRTARVAILEYRLRPDRIYAPAGAIRLVARNLGLLTHNLSVADATRTLASTKPIPPGGTATLAVRLPPGTYALASTIQSDTALGDRGSLTVTRSR